MKIPSAYVALFLLLSLSRALANADVQALARICASGAATGALLLPTELNLLGKENLSPQSPLFKALLSEISRVKNLADIPAFASSALVDRKNVQMGGKGNRGLVVATVDGRKVIVKLLDFTKRSENQPVNEARWYLILNKLGIGPEFLGQTTLENGDRGLVMAYAGEVSFPLPGNETLPAGFEITDAMIQKIRRTGQALKAAGIAYAPDLQFRLGREGDVVELIDPEFFSFTVPKSPQVDLPYDPVDNANRIADQVTELRRQLKATGLAAPGATRPRGGLILLPGAQSEPPPERRLILPR